VLFLSSFFLFFCVRACFQVEIRSGEPTMEDVDYILAGQSREKRRRANDSDNGDEDDDDDDDDGGGGEGGLCDKCGSDPCECP
jgi:hypothetical protein